MSLPYRPVEKEGAASVDDEGATRPLRYRLEADDWGWRGPEGSAAVPGESRSSFLLRLGFRNHDPFHRKIFEAMRKEVSTACQPLLALDVEITPITVSHLECSIYEHASPLTRTVYELAAPHQDNWIIRWMMWHTIEAGSESRLSPPSATPADRRYPSITAPTPHGRSDSRSDSAMASSPPSRPSPAKPIAKTNRVTKTYRSTRKVARKKRASKPAEVAMAASVVADSSFTPPATPKPRATFWDPVRAP